MDPLPTATVADACVRLGIPLRVPHAGLRPLLPGFAVAGRVLPVRHEGSVDVFLEAIGHARLGDVLVVDNEGRVDEGCIGDLVAMEAQAAGLGAIAIWGCHRDTAILRTLGMPLWSCGSVPAGPTRARVPPARRVERVAFGGHDATSDDHIFLDDDGAVLVPVARLGEVEHVTKEILATERAQADQVRAGVSLRRQLRFDAYLAARAADPTRTFREHLRAGGGAIEE
jgi:regulator of RNase E activity RraA